MGQKLGRAWGIGSKDKNNGILVLVALGDRKLSIQTGYGAEGALPDVITHEIIQNDITPRFKQNDYYGGLNIATDDLMKYMRGEYKSARKPQDQEQSSAGGIIILVVIIVFVLIILFRRRGGGGGGQILRRPGWCKPFLVVPRRCFFRQEQWRLGRFFRVAAAGSAAAVIVAAVILVDLEAVILAVAGRAEVGN